MCILETLYFSDTDQDFGLGNSLKSIPELPVELNNYKTTYFKQNQQNVQQIEFAKLQVLNKYNSNRNINNNNNGGAKGNGKENDGSGQRKAKVNDEDLLTIHGEH